MNNLKRSLSRNSVSKNNNYLKPLVVGAGSIAGLLVLYSKVKPNNNNPKKYKAVTNTGNATLDDILTNIHTAIFEVNNAKDAALAAAAAADVAIDAANKATDAALAAAESSDKALVATDNTSKTVVELNKYVVNLGGDLKKQISELSNSVVKIQKKLKV